MRYLVGFMMCVFLLVGAGLIVATVKELIFKLYRMSYFKRALGSIVKVEQKLQRSYIVKSNRGSVTPYSFYPVIKFKHLSGEEVTFKSEIGDVGTTSKYRVGQKIPVVYDIDGKIPPMINSFSGVWLPIILQTVAGMVFIGGAAMIYFAFGDKIFGK